MPRRDLVGRVDQPPDRRDQPIGEAQSEPDRREQHDQRDQREHRARRRTGCRLPLRRARWYSATPASRDWQETRPRAGPPRRATKRKALSWAGSLRSDAEDVAARAGTTQIGFGVDRARRDPAPTAAACPSSTSVLARSTTVPSRLMISDDRDSQARRARRHEARRTSSRSRRRAGLARSRSSASSWISRPSDLALRLRDRRRRRRRMLKISIRIRSENQGSRPRSRVTRRDHRHQDGRQRPRRC